MGIRDICRGWGAIVAKWRIEWTNSLGSGWLHRFLVFAKILAICLVFVRTLSATLAINTADMRTQQSSYRSSDSVARS